MHVTQGLTCILFKTRKTGLNDLIFCYQSFLVSRATFHDLWELVSSEELSQTQGGKRLLWILYQRSWSKTLC